MRTPKENKTDIDLLVPVNVDDFKLDEDDCFGRMWEPTNKDCSICADIEVCGIIYQDRVIKPKKKQYEEEGATPLDLAKFEQVDWINIVKVVEKYEKDGDPMVLSELIDYVKGIANVSDDSIIELYIKSRVKKHNLEINWLNEITKIKQS